jgi:hypothetical protein
VSDEKKKVGRAYILNPLNSIIYNIKIRSSI